MEIIPAMDIMGGRCVRLHQGDFGQKKEYGELPGIQAKQFEEAGCHRLHLVDLDGARNGRVVNWEVLEDVCKATSLRVDFGGGIHSDEDAERVLDSGAQQITLGSMVHKDANKVKEWLKRFGNKKILIGVDALKEQVKISGWAEDTGRNIFAFIDELVAWGIKELFCTDIQKDGMMQGPSVELYQKILYRYPSLRLIASGGVRNVHDLELLTAVGCSGCIVGKALYEGNISLNELKTWHQC